MTNIVEIPTANQGFTLRRRRMRKHQNRK